MGLTGWTLPQSDTGRAAILTPPPWHYSGEIIAVDFIADPAVVAALLPDAIEPAGDGACTFVFADWCSASDADPRVRDDPARGQYREAYVVCYGSLDGKPVARVPFIWVDNDLSLVRGLIQGFPKKLGQIAMTRPVELGLGGVRKAVGSRFAAHVASLGRRLCTVTVTLDEEHEKLFHARDRHAPGPHAAVAVARGGRASRLRAGRVRAVAGDDRGIRARPRVLRPGDDRARRVGVRGARPVAAGRGGPRLRALGRVLRHRRDRHAGLNRQDRTRTGPMQNGS